MLATDVHKVLRMQRDDSVLKYTLTQVEGKNTSFLIVLISSNWDYFNF